MPKSLTLAAILSAAAVATAAAQMPSPAERPQRLPELVLGSETDDLVMSEQLYELTAGQAYRLQVTNAGHQEYMFRAPEFFLNTLIRQVVVEDLEVHTNWIHGLEFDARGTMEIFFTPVRSGEYEWFVEPFDEAMRGRIVVTAAQ